MYDTPRLVDALNTFNGEWATYSADYMLFNHYPEDARNGRVMCSNLVADMDTELLY